MERDGCVLRLTVVSLEAGLERVDPVEDEREEALVDGDLTPGGREDAELDTVWRDERL